MTMDNERVILRSRDFTWDIPKDIPPLYEDELKSVTPESIFEIFFSLEIERLLEFGPQDEHGDLVEENWECKARNILKKKFIEFYGSEAWQKFEVIIRQNLEEAVTDIYQFEDHYSDKYDPDYPEKLAKEFEKYLAVSQTSHP